MRIERSGVRKSESPADEIKKKGERKRCQEGGLERNRHVQTVEATILANVRRGKKSLKESKIIEEKARGCNSRGKGV